MKTVSATDARKDWFRLLDEVATGEVIVIERNGRQIELRRREQVSALAEPPDYSDVLHVPDLDHADRWSWQWGETGQLRLCDDDE